MCLLGTAVKEISLVSSAEMQFEDLGIGYEDGSYQVIPDGLETIGWDDVQSDVRLVVVPSSVRCLCGGLFFACADLKRIVLLEGSRLDFVGEECFSGSGIT